MSEGLTEAEVAAAMEKYRTPAVALVNSHPRETGPRTPGCWLGGQPRLPAHIPWPMYQRPKDDYPSVPMHFLCQLDLARFPRLEGFEEMPERGTMFFFFDPIHTPGGPETWEASAVLYVEEDVSTVPRRTPPPMPDGIEPLSRNYKGTSEYGYWPVELHVVDTYPWEVWNIPKNKPELVDEGYKSAVEQHYEWLEEVHIDTLMPLDERGRSNRFYNILHASLGANAYEQDDVKGGHLYDGVRLLRLDTDYKIGLQVSVDEPVEFWIPRAALRNRDFSQGAMYLSITPMGS